MREVLNEGKTHGSVTGIVSLSASERCACHQSLCSSPLHLFTAHHQHFNDLSDCFWQNRCEQWMGHQACSDTTGRLIASTLVEHPSSIQLWRKCSNDEDDTASLTALGKVVACHMSYEDESVRPRLWLLLFYDLMGKTFVSSAHSPGKEILQESVTSH